MDHEQMIRTTIGEIIKICFKDQFIAGRKMPVAFTTCISFFKAREFMKTVEFC